MADQAARARRVLGIVVAASLALQAVPVPAVAADARQEALDLSKQALDAYLAGQFTRAAALYRMAWQTWPSEIVYLYNAARADERGGKLDEAEKGYEEFLRRAPADHPEAAKARFHLDELRLARQRRAGLPRSMPAKPSQPDDGSGQRTGGTILLVLGGAAAVGGGVVLALAASDQSALDVKLSQKGPGGQIIGIDHVSATSEQSRINTRVYLGWAMVGGGVLAGTIGGVLLATAPARKVTVAPWLGQGGVLVTARF